MPEGRAGAGLWSRPGQRAQGWRRAPASRLGSVFPSVGLPAVAPTCRRGAGAEVHERKCALCLPQRELQASCFWQFCFFNHLMTFGSMSARMVFAALPS